MPKWYTRFLVQTIHRPPDHKTQHISVTNQCYRPQHSPSMKVYLPVLVASWLMDFSAACINIPEYFGTLDTSSEIASSTLASPATSCSCCGLCHQNAACKSFSFKRDMKECVLYGKVGGYSGFSREREDAHNAEFFFLPGRSLTNEFCRSDSDCITTGDFCRGRICTTDTTVTCRDAFLQGSDALPNHRYWGYIDGQEMLLFCRMRDNFMGATLLLASHRPLTDGVPWTTENILYKTYDKNNYPNEEQDYSILTYADIIRDSSDATEYMAKIVALEYEDNEETTQTYIAPKTLTLIGYDMVSFTDGLFTAEPPLQYDNGWLAFPHLKNLAGRTELYSTLNSDTNYLDWRALVTAGGTPQWPLYHERDTVLMYIRE